MRERISRSDDERLYQPKVHSRHIRRLHQISEATGEAMTVIVDQALREFEDRYAEIMRSPTPEVAQKG
jgi:hypothetical protein